MTNTNGFKALLAKKGLTQAEFAIHLGITKASLNYKINGRRPFTQKEIERTIKIFGLKSSEIAPLFFAQ